MKHILVLISILLLSCPLFGQSKKKGLLYIWENGSRYVGEWKDGKKHGQGTYTFPDGKKYVGGWKDSKYHGQGTLTSSDGKYFVGEFKDSKPWNITGYDKNGNIKRKWVNGK